MVPVWVTQGKNSHPFTERGISFTPIGNTLFQLRLMTKEEEEGKEKKRKEKKQSYVR